MPHISLKDLSIAYGDHKVLQDVTVDIPDSQITVIIGPSGMREDHPFKEPQSAP